LGGGNQTVMRGITLKVTLQSQISNFNLHECLDDNVLTPQLNTLCTFVLKCLPALKFYLTLILTAMEFKEPHF
jgi:hypothetical protein